MIYFSLALSSQIQVSNPALIAFYHVSAIKDWTYVNITEYYRAKLENKEYRNVLDCVKKDLTKVAKNSEFDKTRQEKAETILNNWKVCSLLRQKLYIKSLVHQ
jgi:hypothetical protein